jgi:multidrug resistance efflux pump
MTTPDVDFDDVSTFRRSFFGIDPRTVQERINRLEAEVDKTQAELEEARAARAELEAKLAVARNHKLYSSHEFHRQLSPDLHQS